MREAPSHRSVFAPGVTLGALPLAQTTVDLDVEARGDESLIERALDDPRTRVLLVNKGLVAVPKQTGAATPAALDCVEDPAAPRPDAAAPEGAVPLALLVGPDVRDEALREGALVVYLGRDVDVEPAAHYLALDITRLGHAPKTRRPHVDEELGRAGEPLAERALHAFDWIELRSFAPCASPRDVGLATSAVAVCAWHAHQRFCPACGAPVRPALAGWAQTCTNANDARHLLFPRIEPAIITAIVDGDDRLLLQHNRAWRPKFFSVSAGFVEAGESLEHAVRREAREETGVTLGEVGYLGSQPWPFPASIMLAFWAYAEDTEVAVDHDEVASARWFTREELGRAVAAGEVEPPGRASIARHMIELWYGGELPEPAL